MWLSIFILGNCTFPWLKFIEFYDPPSLELYNLADDLGERHNLAEEMPEKAEQLRRKLQNWIETSGATLHTLNPDYDPEAG